MCFAFSTRYLQCQDPACNGVKEVHVKVEQQEAHKPWTHDISWQLDMSLDRSSEKVLRKNRRNRYCITSDVIEGSMYATCGR